MSDCLACGTVIVGKRRKFYCSRSCFRKGRSARRMASYHRCKDKPRTEEWKAKRKATQKKRRAAHYAKNKEHELATNRAYSARHPLHGLWSGMIERCHNPNYPAYRLYGGRGITVCDRWRNSFDTFVADMGPRPTSKHSIDRYPGKNGNYEPTNCRWATAKEQALNCNKTRLVTVDGITDSMFATTRRVGVNESTLSKGMKQGYTPQQVVDRLRNKSGRASISRAMKARWAKVRDFFEGYLAAMYRSFAQEGP